MSQKSSLPDQTHQSFSAAICEYQEALTFALVKLCSRSCKGESHITASTKRLEVRHLARGKRPRRHPREPSRDSRRGECKVSSGCKLKA
ncbi:hypothetical protein E2C01_022818 [Portunus trituberculatus]|uniref:Uncharacterized protein n=1 Tax=Portunus trituberculatus TaxID=210409 RepID=A0A5B7E899_PORTR|nr:hypothetical protein [Portunus trituberculatus]